MKGFVVWVVFGGKEATFCVGHFTEVVFNISSHVAGGADVVQGTRASAATAGGIEGICIAVLSSVSQGCGDMGGRDG